MVAGRGPCTRVREAKWKKNDGARSLLKGERCPETSGFLLVFIVSQLFSDPGKKGTLFWEDHFSGAATKKKGTKGATEQLRYFQHWKWA